MYDKHTNKKLKKLCAHKQSVTDHTETESNEPRCGRNIDRYWEQAGKQQRN